MPSAQEYAAEYRQGAADLRAAVQSMTREQVTARPVPGKWSTLEVVCHIADFEPVYVERMKRILTAENPTLQGADQEDFARVLHYQERDLEEELRVVEATRNAMARIMEKLTTEQLARPGVHSERGPVTLEKIIQTIIGHIPHHLPFIAEKRRALGLR